MTHGPPGMSALQLQKWLGMSRYETAFQMLHKLRAAMVQPNRDVIGSEHPVEVDETLVGGARATARALEAVGKAARVKIVETGRFVRENALEVGKGLRRRQVGWGSAWHPHRLCLMAAGGNRVGMEIFVQI